jgi:chromate reductase
MSSFKVGYFVGSLSTSSINRVLAKALVRVAPPELTLTEIAIKDLPLYNRDQDNDYPPVAGAVTNAETEKFLMHYMTEFHAFITRVYTVLPRNA